VVPEAEGIPVVVPDLAKSELPMIHYSKWPAGEAGRAEEKGISQVSFWKISEREDKYEIFAHVEVLGDDLLVVLWGGTKPHIGAIGMAQPRPSLKDSKRISATSSAFTFLGHKEDVVAKAMSEELARELNRKVVVVAGMHWEGLRDEGIEEVIGICQRLKHRILEEIRRL
jgi:hypothetical protein